MLVPKNRTFWCKRWPEWGGGRNGGVGRYRAFRPIKSKLLKPICMEGLLWIPHGTNPLIVGHFKKQLATKVQCLGGSQILNAKQWKASCPVLGTMTSLGLESK